MLRVIESVMQNRSVTRATEAEKLTLVGLPAHFGDVGKSSDRGGTGPADSGLWRSQSSSGTEVAQDEAVAAKVKVSLLLSEGTGCEVAGTHPLLGGATLPWLGILSTLGRYI